MRTLEIRPSTISSMMLCPARQILQPEDEAVTAEALVFGTFVHWRIEQNLAGVKGLTFDDMQTALATIYFDDTDGGDINDVASKRQLREMINECMVAFEQWHETVLPQLPNEPPIIEHTLRTSIWKDNDVEIFLTGTPDAIYPAAGLIVDWKTAGRNWNADKAYGQVQPWAYTLMAEWEGHEISGFHFWVYDRSTETWWRHPHELEDRVVAQEALMKQAAAFALQIESGIPTYSPAGAGFKPRGWHCSPQYCDQWGQCDGKYLVADGQATQPALDAKTKGWS